MDNIRLGTMTDAVRYVVKHMDDGQVFHGNELKRAVVRVYSAAKDMYPDTILRMMRRYCRSLVRCVDHNAGKYMKVDGPELFDKEESK